MSRKIDISEARCVLHVSLSHVMQTEDDAPGEFSFRVDGTSSFTVTTDGYVVLNKEGLDYETIKEVKFKVSI